MISSEEFKAGMSRWTTGVTVVTARDGGRVHGMTVSDFTGVSLSPPLVLVCAGRDTITREVIAAGRCFAVHVLSAEQEELSNRFASKEFEHERFDGLEIQTGATGAPLLSGAVAVFDCRLESSFEVGDHEVYVGQVEELIIHDREPLVYQGGRYDRLDSFRARGKHR